MITEAATEKKPKRGRPRLAPVEFDRLLEFKGPGQSRRNHTNLFHAGFAQAVMMKGLDVENDEDLAATEFGWLFCPKPRWGLLSELGRFVDHDTIREYARQICELKPGAKRGIAILRRIRTGIRPEAHLQNW